MRAAERIRARRNVRVGSRLRDRRALRAAIREPAQVTVSQWPTRHRELSPFDGEYQRGIMDALSDPLIDKVVLMKPVASSRPRSAAYGGPQHRIAKVTGQAKGSRVQLPDLHPALVDGRTLFPSTVVDAATSPRLLVSGMNSRKTGRLVVKGRWRGCPIFTLTLEERATCPRSCEQWRTCYGNNMHYARRHAAGDALEQRLIVELRELAAAHPGGFVVRLHILGDFYSPDYVRLWARMLDELPALRVFGFTAHAIDSAIGAAVLRMTGRADGRCWIRFSGLRIGPLGSVVIDAPDESRGVICPAQTGATDCCATCGLCWASPRTIEFLRH